MVYRRDEGSGCGFAGDQRWAGGSAIPSPMLPTQVDARFPPKGTPSAGSDEPIFVGEQETRADTNCDRPLTPPSRCWAPGTKPLTSRPATEGVDGGIDDGSVPERIEGQDRSGQRLKPLSARTAALDASGPAERIAESGTAVAS